MGTFLLRRLIQMILTVFLSSLCIFGIMFLVPGGPFDEAVRGKPSPDTAKRLEQLNNSIGLNQSFPERYSHWISGIVTRGDFGKSWVVQKGVPVGTIMNERIYNSLKITVSSLLISLVLGLSVGIFSAVHPYSTADYSITAFTFLGVAMPTFWLGPLLIILFYSKLHWLPPSQMMEVRSEMPGAGGLIDQLKHLVLPVMTLSIVSVATWSRFVRASMLEVMNQDYIRTARAKGLREQTVIYKHALRNAMIPVVTLVALSIPGLIAAAPITETVFSWPGLGNLLINSVLQIDAPIAQGILILIALLTVVSNLLADILYAVIDPRIRMS